MEDENWEQMETYATRFLDPRRVISHAEQEVRFFGAREALYWRAEEARRRGKSYRNFLVGCAAWVHYPGAILPEERWRVFLGANSKIAKDRRNI